MLLPIFPIIFSTFFSDVRARVSFWYSLTELGFSLPKREPLSKIDLAEEERVRKAIVDARALLHRDDSDMPCRVVRLFTGYKMVDGEEVTAKNELDRMDDGLSSS